MTEPNEIYHIHWIFDAETVGEVGQAASSVDPVGFSSRGSSVNYGLVAGAALNILAHNPKRIPIPVEDRASVPIPVGNRRPGFVPPLRDFLPPIPDFKNLPGDIKALPGDIKGMLPKLPAIPNVKDLFPAIPHPRDWLPTTTGAINTYYDAKNKINDTIVRLAPIINGVSDHTDAHDLLDHANNSRK